MSKYRNIIDKQTSTVALESFNFSIENGENDFDLFQK